MISSSLVPAATSFSASRRHASIRRLAPRLGEHTQEVLAEAGLTAAEIAAATGG